MIKNMMRRAVSSIAVRVSPVRWKEFNELNFWKEQKNAQGVLSNGHYKYFYTTHFGLDESYYNNKVILDIGCGPRGSLEWASMASRRIGLDSLAKEYLKLGADQHQMEYIDSSSENIPLMDSECDAVFSFNSLDHVEDLDQTVKEIKRVTRPGGIFLLLVEVNHPPTSCEPQTITPKKVVELLKPEFACKSLVVYKPLVKNDMYLSIRANKRFSNPEGTAEIGWMSAKFLRTV